MKNVFATIFFFAVFCASAQTTMSYEQQQFCKSLKKVLESGRAENFESIMSNSDKGNVFIPVPGTGLRLKPFDIFYVDKDSRFVGKTNENLDSLSALNKLEEYKVFVGDCLDSTWKWSEHFGDDSSTVFFTEHKELRANTKDLRLDLAMDIVRPKIYMVNLYIRRNKVR